MLSEAVRFVESHTDSDDLVIKLRHNHVRFLFPFLTVIRYIGTAMYTVGEKKA